MKRTHPVRRRLAEQPMGQRVPSVRPPARPRIAVVGSGAIGCFLASRLAARGYPVVLIGREAQVAAIRANGLRVRDASASTGNEEQIIHLRAQTTLTERPDLVLLTVKTQDVADACRSLLPVAADVPVVALQNGLQADRLAADVLGERSVLGGVVVCASSYVEPGVITVQFPGWLIVGEAFHPLGWRARWVAKVLGDAVPVLLTHHLDRARWSKLIFNLNNGIWAATGLSLPEVGKSPVGQRLSLALMHEGLRVARAERVRLEYGFGMLRPHVVLSNPQTALLVVLQAAMNFALLHLPASIAAIPQRAAGRSALGKVELRGSTWQSIARGRPTEVDFLNGEIVRRGETLGVPTPYDSRVVEAIHEVERTRVFLPLEALFPEHDTQYERGAQHVGAGAAHRGRTNDDSSGGR